MTYSLHTLNRPGQLEAYNFIMASKKPFVFIKAPTGSGKSAWAAEASKSLKTLVLVHTKSLQAANYGSSYGFDILFGKGNYPCLDYQIMGYRTDDCLHKDPCGTCPYYIRYGECLVSERVSLNYMKYLLTRPFTEAYKPDILFLDEGHQLRNIITNFVGITIRFDSEFIEYDNQGFLELDNDEAYDLLTTCFYRTVNREPDQKKDLAKHRKWRNLRIKIKSTLSNWQGDDWYYEVNEEKLVCKPLTAKYHFKSLFKVAPKIVLMSATLNPNLLASELGIEEYDYYEVPNIYPTPMRRIWDLNAPKLNWQSTDLDKIKHAKSVGNAILNQPSDWTGVIHVTSKFMARELSGRLEGQGIKTFIPPENAGTDEQLQAWYDNRQPGLCCISWSFHEGVDLGQDQYCIVAKTPYASIGDGYDRARMEYDKSLYRQETAYKLEQATGRVRRGFPEHYIPSNKFVAIADNGWHGVKSMLSRDFLRSVKKYEY